MVDLTHVFVVNESSRDDYPGQGVVGVFTSIAEIEKRFPDEDWTWESGTFNSVGMARADSKKQWIVYQMTLNEPFLFEE